MAVSIIDPLEIVGIDHQHRQGTVVPQLVFVCIGA